LAIIERLAVLIDANAQGATREFRKLSGEAQRTDAQLTRTQKATGALGTALKRFGPLAAAGAGVALGKFADQAIDAASALEEAESKASVVFGSSFPKLQGSVDEISDSFNIAEREVFEFASAFGQILKGADFSPQDVAKYSQALVELTADFASFNDLSVEESFTKLQSGLAGETEAVRRYGIDVSAASVKTEAYASGIADLGAELTEAQKFQARLNIILKETADVQGDVARTADSLANRQREAAAASEDFSAQIGESLAPLKADALGVLADLTNAFGDLDSFLKRNSDGSRFWRSIRRFVVPRMRLRIKRRRRPLPAATPKD